MALILALSRRLPEARDNQQKGVLARHDRRSGAARGRIGWEDAAGGRPRQIGGRLAELAKAFDMKRHRAEAQSGCRPRRCRYGGGIRELKIAPARADFVALTCPLTPETEKLIDAAALARMKPSAYLINVARGRVVDEAALVEALTERRLAGAGIDVTVEEPLAPSSSLWTMKQVLITPHNRRRNTALRGQRDRDPA